MLTSSTYIVKKHMNAILPLFIFSFLLLGPSFSATSLLSSHDSVELPTVKKVMKGDASQLAVEAFNKGDYFSAVLKAQPLAEKGNPFALLVMGLAYESGRGIDQSQELALKNYRKARDAGNKEASYRLARLLGVMGGDGQQKEAQEILEALSKEDRGEAARMLGEGCLQGWFGGKADFDRARTWWEKSAEKGDEAAAIALARLLDGEFGFPEKRNPADALNYYLRAAELGNGRAMAIAGSRLLNGEEEIRDEKKARKWLAMAIENKELDAYLVLGNFAEKVTKSDPVAFAEYLKGAEAGQSQCMLLVASFMMEGRGGQEKNPEEALAWFKKAGEAGQILGHVQAASILLGGDGLKIVEGYSHLVVAAESGLVDMQNEVGLLYLTGRLGVQDFTAAASWFRRSANGKYPAGAFNLATLFERGLGVPQNFDQAGRLYTQAANSGHVKATTALGRFHAEGKGTKQELPRAWALFSLAMERGDEAAKRFKEAIDLRLNDDEIKKAREILAEYKKAPAPSKGEAGE
jgi:uncharacterized protein